ncbi:prenyltransferase [Myxococcota bacterium]|nr:prenyltransferase [Myxococcota bacterium]
MGASVEARIRAMSLGARWWYALKPASWPKLLVPAALGQALGVASTDAPSWAALLFGALFTVFDLVFIVLLNDWGDRDVDAIKRRMFPDGCSPKTIPDGILPARHLLLGGLAAGAAAITVAVIAEHVLARPGLGLFGAGAIALFLAYTFPPIALNYRGGGELLELAGVGVVLPALHVFLQSGVVFAPAPMTLVAFASLSLASALASGLSDEESDRAGGKRTFTTAFGNTHVRQAIELATGAGALAFALAVITEGVFVPPWGTIAAAIVVGAKLRALRAISPEARTNAFAAQARYKGALHEAIWGGTSIVALSVVARWVLGS